MGQRITSKQLAVLAGVSSATVSRAFSPNSRISRATRERILSMAEEHHYQPNAIARSLNNSRSRLVAIVVNTMGNPCEAEQLQALVHRLQERELLPIILSCEGEEDRRHLMRMASAYRVDHAVICSDRVPLKDAMQIFRDTNMIVVSHEPIEGGSASQVRFDGTSAAKQVVDKAVGDGRRRFAYLNGRRSSWVDKQRKAWFGDALGRHGLIFQAEGHGDFTYDAGFKETVLMLRRAKVDALICGNDVMAIGARDAATRVLGREVPADLAIVGQDGITMAAWESHDLTTLALDNDVLVETILGLIGRDAADPRHASVATIAWTVRWGATC